MGTANDLKKHGFSTEDCQWLAELGVSTLTDMQSAGLRALDQRRRKGVFLLGPTSSGKTFLFVLSALKVVAAGGRALLLVTTRSQQAEFARRFLPHFRDRGFRTFPGGEEGALRTGDFDIAVAVYEQAFAALPSLTSSMESRPSIIGLDEFDIAYDKSRGITAATIAKRVICSTKARFLATSAALQPEDDLVVWSGLIALTSGQRGVPLRRGIFSGGDFIYEEYNSGARGKESIVGDFPAMPEQDSLRFLAREMHLRGESSLVFLRDRNSTRRQARQLAHELRSEMKAAAVPAELRLLPETFSRELLCEVVPMGVGFHNADLTAGEREAVERMIVDGRLKSVMCTGTLGRGVNLPIRNVLVEGLRWEEDCDTFGLRAITAEEFESLGGRAGRMGFATGEGRAMVIRPAGIGSGALEELLDMPCCGARRLRSGDETAEALAKTMYVLGSTSVDELARFVSDGPFGITLSREAVAGALKGMEDGSMARLSKGGWQLSKIGAIAVANGLSLDGAMKVAEFLATFDFEKGSAAAWLWEACGLRETASNLPPASPHEAARLIDELGGQESVPVSEVLRFGLDTPVLRRLKGTAALYLKFKGAKEKEIESRAWVSAGVQQVLGKSVGSITRTARSIAHARGQAKAADFLDSILARRAADAEEGDATVVELVIAGQGRDRSGDALIGGKKARLRLATYELLEQLAIACEDGEGWVRGSRLTQDGDSERARKYVSQLRTELKPYVAFNPVENDGEGSYRLSKSFRVMSAPGQKGLSKA
ncbi:MAG: DEAD/DEAH box helicase [Candidatus Brocadiia bacterium]